MRWLCCFCELERVLLLCVTCTCHAPVLFTQRDVDSDGSTPSRHPGGADVDVSKDYKSDSEIYSAESNGHLPGAAAGARPSALSPRDSRKMLHILQSMKLDEKYVPKR